MTIILDQYAIPTDTGIFEIRQTVNIQISAKQAKRKVSSWLLNEVSMMIGADMPTLVVGERAIWRVPAFFSTPSVGRVGQVGVVDVDAATGEMCVSDELKNCILQRAKKMGKNLPPFRPLEIDPKYLAKDIQPTHAAGRPVGNPAELAFE